jgi:VWA domain-containing protein
MDSDLTGFTAVVHQNRYLPTGGTTVDLVVEVTASAGARLGDSAPPSAAQLLMIDCSGSMADPPAKLVEAKRATIAAIDTLRDGVAFAVIAGRDDAQLAYPLVPASPRTRAEARQAVALLEAGGGTALGTWLRLASNVFRGTAAEVKHAIMLTDGRNEHEAPQQLAAALRACEGRFVCDTRGVGDGWSGTELRLVASALLGTADGLARPADLAGDFRQMTEAAMGKALGEVALRLWTPAGSAVRFVRQAYPHVDDLSGRRAEVSPRIGEYPTGAWGTETRDYHIRVNLQPGAPGEERLAARVSLVSRDEVLVETRATAIWTDDRVRSTRIDPVVAHYTGQAELAAAIQEGLEAREAGDVATATDRLGRAVQLAEQTGHRETSALLERLVDVMDATTGSVRLRTDVSEVDAEMANVRSVRTIQTARR